MKPGGNIPAAPRPELTLCSVAVRNHQHGPRVNSSLLERIVRALLADIFRERRFDICIHLVGAPAIARLNEKFLRHSGPTDVIAFDYRERPGEGPLFGEVFVCVPVALEQAKRYRTAWESELIRTLCMDCCTCVAMTIPQLGRDAR